MEVGEKGIIGYDISIGIKVLSPHTMCMKKALWQIILKLFLLISS
jgi:hypothetical protein